MDDKPTEINMTKFIRQCSDCDKMVEKKYFVNNPLCESCIKKYPKFQQEYANSKCVYQPQKAKGIIK